MKSKGTAAILAFFLGGIGIHHFYLGRSTAGILSLLFFWTFIPAFVALVNFIQLLIMNDEEFNRKYNFGAALQNATTDVGERLSKLHVLKQKGGITEAEYEAQKRNLLKY